MTLTIKKKLLLDCMSLVYFYNNNKKIILISAIYSHYNCKIDKTGGWEFKEKNVNFFICYFNFIINRQIRQKKKLI